MSTLLWILLAAPVGVWGMEPCVAVQSDRFSTADLAQRVAAFETADGSQLLGYTPAPGLKRVLRRPELESIARRLGVAADMPSDVCIERVARPLSRERVERALRKAIDGTGARIELLDFANFPVPDGEIEFPRAGIMQPRQGSGNEPTNWKGHVLYSGRRSVGIWARVRITAVRRRVVAVAELPSGRPIPAAALRLEEREEYPFGETHIQSLEEIAGKIPRRPIRAGEPIKTRLLADAREVDRNDRVEVSVESGAARLSFVAKAETGGRAGERVLVRNPDNGQRFVARVESKGKVTVTAGGDRNVR